MEKIRSEHPDPEAPARKFAFAPVRYASIALAVALVAALFTEGKALILLPFLLLAFLVAILYVLCDIRFMVWKMKK